MKRMNEALSERVRDIKLILNRRYFELEDNIISLPNGLGATDQEDKEFIDN